MDTSCNWLALKECTLGQLPLGRTLWVSAIHAGVVLLTVWLVVSIVPAEDLKYDVRQLFVLFQSVIRLSAIVWAGQCVMRACIRRTGDGNGRSIVVSGCVFMLALWGTAQAAVSMGGATRAISENWYHEKHNGWVPLNVIADPILGRIVVKGDITHDSARLFKAVVRANPALTVVQIESYGGYVNEAMQMARLIRALKLDTVSMRRCASACTLMFVAGQNRYLGPEARFRFHRAGYEGMPGTEKLEELDQELARFYVAMGTGPQIAAGELATPNHSFWEPSQGELFAANYATLKWSERPAGL
jgi:ATP-dependent protease ClpP protease subunit